MPTVGMVSLGCAKNRVDGELMLGRLKDKGYELVSDPAQAEVILVNTCGFIEEAKQESIDAIFEMAEYKKDRCRALIVTGCLSQRYGKELLEQMPEADAFLGIGEIENIDQAVEQALAGKRFLDNQRAYCYPEQEKRVLTTPGHYAYVKIAEGCSNRCAYCAIPYIRGPLLSRPMENIEQEVRQLCAAGVQEINLVAQDTTRYGEDLYGKPQLPELLRRLSALPETRWLRVLYCYPDNTSDELLQLMHDDPKICSYIDIPLQHVHDKVLREMNRRGDHALIDRLYHRIRELGGFALRTTMIAGFPGETEEEFRYLLDYVKTHPFDRLGAFAYSREEGTPAAARKDQVPLRNRRGRANRLMRQQRPISRAFNQARVGSVVDVLVEEEEMGLYVGRSQWEAPETDGRIYIELAENLQPGQIVPVRLTKALDYDMMGVLAQP